MGRGRADKSLLPGVFDLRARPASVGLGRAGKQTGPLACSTLSRGPGSSRQFGEASFGGSKDRLTKLCAGPGSGGPGRARSQAGLIVLDPVPQNLVQRTNRKHQVKVTCVLNPVQWNRN